LSDCIFIITFVHKRNLCCIIFAVYMISSQLQFTVRDLLRVYMFIYMNIYVPLFSVIPLLHPYYILITSLLCPCFILHFYVLGAVVKYARLIKDKGWFTVRLIDVSLRSSSLSKYRKVGVSAEMHIQNGGISTTSIGKIMNSTYSYMSMYVHIYI
jgi:hypothetical protein